MSDVPVYRLDDEGLERARAYWREDPRSRHLEPLYEAVLRGVALALVLQHAGPWRQPTRHPPLVLVGDDMDESLGPAAFHVPSLRRVLRRASHVAVHSGQALPVIYAAAAEAVLATRRPVVLIETRERHEADWMHFVRRYAPKAERLLVTPMPEGRPS